MKIDLTDPRLTAYALGEMDRDEAARVADLVAGDPEALAAVESIRRAGRVLAAVLALETAPALGDAERAALLVPPDAAHAPDREPADVAARGTADARPAAAKPVDRLPDPRPWWKRVLFTRPVAGLAVAAVAIVLVANINVSPIYRVYYSTLMWLNVVKTASGHAGAMKESVDNPMPEGARITVGDVLLGRADDRLRGMGLTPPQSGAKTGLPGAVAQLPAAVATPAPQAPLTGGAPPSSDAETGMGLSQEVPYESGAAYPTYPPAAPAWPLAPTAVPYLPNTYPPFNTESYDQVVDNPFRTVQDEPLSTFSIDVDTASYANVRRFLTQGSLPPADAVRIEELVNYFEYAYAPPGAESDDPFAVDVAVGSAPWAPEHRLVRIGIKGRELAETGRASANLVFLIDVSGSMDEPNKLPLVQSSLRMLAENLRADDRVAIVVYAGASGLVLPGTSGGDRYALLGAIDRLQAGGSTNGGEGIQLAYNIAMGQFVQGGINRVILATDGDFNVGVTDEGSLVRLIEDKAKSGVFLTVLGFGMGNYQDAMLEKLADKGNGNYAYIDGLSEARKVLVEQVSGTLVTIAKDVKIQVEFNPAAVGAYRLIGYENRILAAEDFNDDTKDAGEIGAGHTVTALYEVVPVGVPLNVPGVDPLRYQTTPQLSGAAESGELLTVKLRYKQPDGLFSRLLERAVVDAGLGYQSAPPDFLFAASVAEFGMLLRGSPYRGQASYDQALGLAQAGLAADPGGYRAEFVTLVRQAQALAAWRQ